MQDYRCDNCGRKADRDDLPDATHLSERLTPGAPYTDKECSNPECGALCYPIHQAPARPLGSRKDETMREVKRYKVTGRGPFPVDMLRYDRVSPASEADSYAMGCEIGADHGSRTVEVEGRGCTPARWLSFLWAVVVDSDQA